MLCMKCHIYKVKVSTTVFKVLVFKTHALFIIFSDYGQICFWNNMLQLHTTACAVSSCWWSLSDVFFQLPCFPCVHSNANIPRQKVHHLFSYRVLFLIRWLLICLLPLLCEPCRTFGTTSFTEHSMPTTDWIFWLNIQNIHFRHPIVSTKLRLLQFPFKNWRFQRK